MSLVEGYFDKQQTELGSLEYFSYNKLKIALVSMRYFYNHYKNKQVYDSTKAMDFGNLGHMAILERDKFREKFIVEPKEFWGLTKEGKPSTQSADAKEKRAKWNEEQKLADRIIVSDENYEKLLKVLKNLKEDSSAMNLLSGGKKEKWAYADFRQNPNIRRWFLGRSDSLNGPENNPITVELKFSHCASNERAFKNHAAQLYYPMQIAMNCMVNSKLAGLEKSNRKAAWIAICTKTFEPFVYTMHEDDVAEGEAQAQFAMDLINFCLDRDPNMEKEELWPIKSKGVAKEIRFEPWHFPKMENYLTMEDMQ